MWGYVDVRLYDLRIPKSKVTTAGLLLWEKENAQILAWFHNSGQLSICIIFPTYKPEGRCGTIWRVCILSLTLPSSMSQRCLQTILGMHVGTKSVQPLWVYHSFLFISAISPFHSSTLLFMIIRLNLEINLGHCLVNFTYLYVWFTKINRDFGANLHSLEPDESKK